MRSLLFVCVVLAAANAADASQNGGNALKALEAHAAKAFGLISDIKSHWDNEVSKERASNKKRTEDLEARVEALQHDDCGHGRFACGDGQCVSELSVCDGDKECFNGHDEDICDSKLHAGAVFTSHNIYVDTCSTRHPSTVKLVITGVKRYSYFHNVLQVSANIVLITEDKEHDEEVHASLPAKGYFSFARHELVLAPPENDRVGVSCKFYGHHVDECSGHFFHEASGESCASFLMHRE